MKDQIMNILTSHAIELGKGEFENTADHLVAVLRADREEADKELRMLRGVAKSFSINGYDNDRH